MGQVGKIGAVTVVGGGIAGIQAALDIANSGFKVYLVEEQPCVGGVMAQLDKTFPTNDCSSCMMGPKLVELANHPNIDILAYSELLDLSGEPGHFQATVRKKARGVDPQRCLGCGLCAAKCPVKVADPFNSGLSERRAIYIPFPQAVPLLYTIDKEHCRYFTKGKCRICEKLCQNQAIQFDQKDEFIKIDTGSIILAGGFQPFDARLKPEYGYGLWPNIVTSLDYERILSAAGPFQGHIQRLSDAKTPQRLAWIQCVGSRDQTLGRDYCSSVCCMVATKQAMITKEHIHDAETTIFYIDVRAQGKGFDRFYDRARDEYGVRYVRSMVSRVLPVPETDRLQINYVDEQQNRQQEEFDLVMLSIGLCPHPSTIELAKRIGIGLNEYGFVARNPLDLISTTRKGIYVSGVARAPKDIPDTIQQGSSAAARATALLSEVRGSLISNPPRIEERGVKGEQPRIGVFVCHCGINIAGVVNVEEVAAYAQSLPNVVWASHCLFACSTDQQKEIKRIIQEYQLNRVIVASCTPRTHEPLFRNTLKEAGLNPYLFELTNIREQDAWVHQAEPALATNKAKDLVRMSVSRSALLEPLQGFSSPVVQRALIVGGGLAGLTAAKSVAEQGYPAVLVEATDELGGNARDLFYTDDQGANPAHYVGELIGQVENDPLITVYRGTRLVSMTGSCGNFTSTLSFQGREEEIPHGVVIVATGGQEYKPTEYLYGQHPQVVTQKEFENLMVLKPDQARQFRKVIMIQCVGSREPEHSYCSRVCCSAAVKNSLKFKELNSQAEMSVLYRDMRTVGFKEVRYQEARKQGVRFFRFEAGQKPQVAANGEGLQVFLFDAGLARTIRLEADLLVLSAAIRPREAGQELAELLRLPLDQDGFFLEAHPKLRPLDFATPGFFLCGLAQGPKFANAAIAQAQGAVARAMTILSQKEIVTEGVMTEVDGAFCRACGACEQTCLFGAIKVTEIAGSRKQAMVAQALCTGCGACNVACPTGAASLAHFRDKQVNAMIRAV